MESKVVKVKNMLVQVTIIKLTKENYLHWTTAITMKILGIGHIRYINEKKKQQNEDDSAWNLWYLT